MTKLALPTEPAAKIKAGDLCFDNLLQQFFIAHESEVEALRKRGISFCKVKNGKQLMKNFNPK
jgi:hypothetical protein